MDETTRLATAAAQGDEAALDALVRSLYPQVRELCAALVDRSCADDLAQECFVRVVRALPGFRAEASARTWLLAIARRVCMDELRTRHRRRRRDAARSALRLDLLEPVADAGGVEETVDLLRALEPDRRAAFVLTQQIGLTYAEAAAVCGCPTGTIRSRVARARADLVDLLNEADDLIRDEGQAGSRPS